MVVLLSGGLDSAVALHWALERCDNVRALTLEYGQRHWAEIACAHRIAKRAGVKHEVVNVGGRGIGPSSLTDWKRSMGEGDADSSAPTVFTPGRNMLFLVTASVHALAASASHVVLASNLDDAKGFPDCRGPFVDAMSEALALGLGTPMRVLAPFVLWPKAELVRWAHGRGGRAWEAVGKSMSCYSPVNVRTNQRLKKPCGKCGACVVRARAFAAAGVDDPASGKVVPT